MPSLRRSKMSSASRPSKGYRRVAISHITTAKLYTSHLVVKFLAAVRRWGDKEMMR